MAFCNNCGQQLPEGADFCANCGAATNQTAQQPAYNTQQPTPQAPVQQAPQPVDDVQGVRGYTWLSYVGLVFLVPMFVAKNSKFARFHVKQGATLFATELAYLIATKLLLLIIGLIFPGTDYYFWYEPSGVYTFFNVVFNLGYIYFFVMSIIGIVKAATGQIYNLPLISKIPFINQLLDKVYYKD